jgi:hypothetical protein
MEEIIGGWTGKIVVVVLRVGGGMTEHKHSTLEGKLLKVAESGVLLELPKDRPRGGPTNQTFVPVAAILHICLSGA